jgi:hypothetical protein
MCVLNVIYIRIRAVEHHHAKAKFQHTGPISFPTARGTSRALHRQICNSRHTVAGRDVQATPHASISNRSDNQSMRVSHSHKSGELTVAQQVINRRFGTGGMRVLLSVSAYVSKSFGLGLVLEAGGEFSAVRIDSSIAKQESNLEGQWHSSSLADRIIFVRSSRDRVKTQDIVIS